MSKEFSAAISSGMADEQVPVSEVETVEISRACTMAQKAGELQQASANVVQATAYYMSVSAELISVSQTVSQAQL